MWTTEIWDLRGSPRLSRDLENATAHPEVVARARWASGLSLAGGSTASALATTSCEPAPSWHTCMACRGSALEPHCNATFQWYAGKERARGRRA